jgi:hypothetical protein
MFCHISYNVNKKLLRDYFFDNFSEARHHKTAGSEIPYWLKLFSGKELIDPIICDLGLSGLNVMPRFSFQYKNTLLPKHIDIDRIVGININLMEDQRPTIHINGDEYHYECALIDVGSKIHSIEPESYDRLVLKLAFREPWDRIYNILRSKELVEYSEYESILEDRDKVFVML